MRCNTPLLISISLLLLLIACNNITKEDLYGDWQAVQLTEEGQEVPVNLSEINLLFKENSYHFNSTLKYREAGTYRLQSNLLITKDTINNNRLEKGIEIYRMMPDSLYLRMNEEGKERLLVMVRKRKNEK